MYLAKTGLVTGLLLLGGICSQFSLRAQPRQIRGTPRHHDYTGPKNPLPQLSYQGGALVAHASYWTIYWGTYWTSGIGLAQRKHLNSFVQTVAPTAGFAAQFSEYQEPLNPILAGSWAGEKIITAGAPTTSVDDSQIQAQISTWITQSTVPVPDANTVYVVFPAAGVDVTSGGSSACDPNNGFLGYHSEALSPSGTFGRYRYVVMPYQNCEGDTGADSPITVNGLTDTLGHEMSEVETDPDTGGFLAGWFDVSSGNEIADICADTSATMGFLNFWVQKNWSNAAATCIGPADGSAAIHLTISTAALIVPGQTEPSGAADILPGFPATYTISTDSAAPISLAVSGLPAGVSYTLSHATVTSAASVTLKVSTDTAPGASGTADVTATLSGQSARFQFLVAPWIAVNDAAVTHTAFTFNNTLRVYTGTLTVKNNGTQAIGPTILMAYHGLDSNISPATQTPEGAVGFGNGASPSGDFVAQFPDGMLAPGKSASVNVAFSNPQNLAISFTPQVFVIQSAKACDISQNASTNVSDVQLMIDEALGSAPFADDLNTDGTANIADIQLVINSAMGLGCSSAPME